LALERFLRAVRGDVFFHPRSALVGDEVAARDWARADRRSAVRVEYRAVLRECGVLRGQAARVRGDEVRVRVEGHGVRGEAGVDGVDHVGRRLEHGVVAGDDAHEELLVRRAVAMAGVHGCWLVSRWARGTVRRVRGALSPMKC